MKLTLPTKFRKYHNLMIHRVREVLLVSSLYDAFILQEDGHLSEQIFHEYKELSLSSSPRVTHASTGEEALKLMEERRFDLVLATTRLVDMDLVAFGRLVKERRPGRPVVVLAFENTDVDRLLGMINSEAIDAVFTWNGDAKILLAIIKHIEDRQNLDNDIAGADVRVILVVEDSVRYYSSILASLYPVMMKQSQSLFAEGLNLLQKLMRMRTRPKILHTTTYEEALRLYEKYHDNILAVISDVGFYREWKHDPEAGLRLARHIRREGSDLPILLQSLDPEYEAKARELSALFVDKNSPTLLHTINNFLVDYLGFGDFVFRLPDGREVARAGDIRELEKCIAVVPAESLEYHTRRDHVSNWLMARSEFELAAQLKAKTVGDFSSIEGVRAYLLQELARLRKGVSEGMVTDFSRFNFEPDSLFQRIGAGSLGGKARGLAFLNLLVSSEFCGNQLAGLAVQVPQTFVLTTDSFDKFMQQNNLQKLAHTSTDDQGILHRFIEARLPDETVANLEAILGYLDCPLAVRSSSLLEDSVSLPFAGIYRTLMIPNNAPELSSRLEDLKQAIKMIYASTFFRDAKAYVENTARRIEEEKMAVVIQRLVGQRFGHRFYPHLAGVARSYNYYPLGPLKAEDGVVQVALGFGRLVVEGGQCLRFSPRMPQVVPQFATPLLTLKNSQNKFYALDLAKRSTVLTGNFYGDLTQFDLQPAVEDGTLQMLGSVYDAHDNVITERTDVKGPWVVTFNNILKHQMIPLAPALSELLKLAAQGVGQAAEIEFACDMGDEGRKLPRGVEPRPPILYVVQLRPIITHEEGADQQPDHFEPERIVCRTRQALGHGLFENLSDVVYVKHETFNAAKSPLIARQIGQINAELQHEKRSYILIGPGRWGSSDPWLGIPVQWAQIAGARIIIEASPEGYNVDPSQGTHFFHNITSLNIGYFTLPPAAKKGEVADGEFIDWDWLNAQPAKAETEFLRHVRLPRPLQAHIDGRKGLGVILKDSAQEALL